MRIVGHRTVAVHCNGDRTHAQHTESHQAEGKDGGVFAQDIAHAEGIRCHIGYEHQYKEHKAGPEATKVARHQPGEDVERGTTLAGGVHHFVHVCRGG